MVHVLNWYAGWASVLGAFVTGAVLGMFFLREGFLGGYNAPARRLVRLGHIAMAALGILNIVYAIAPWPAVGSWQGGAASALFVIGEITMPAVCFLTAWRRPFRHLFFIPVGSLMIAVIIVLMT